LIERIDYDTGKRTATIAPADDDRRQPIARWWSSCACRKPTRSDAWVFLLGLLLFLFYQPFAIQRGENGDAWVAPVSRLNFQERGWRKPPALFFVPKVQRMGKETKRSGCEFVTFPRSLSLPITKGNQL
jgi:hypothetical protein